MKRFFLSLLLLSAVFAAKAQSGDYPKSEVKWNIASTIAFASVEVGYEYFFDNNQSVGAEVLINDSYNFGIGRQAKDFDTNSFQLTYNFYTGAENASGFEISPMLKFRFGEYQKSDIDPVVDMDSFILGIGCGYKWNFSDKFVFGPYITIGRNFSEEVNDEFDNPIEFSAGFGVGYRF
ncbi:MAG TPA: hypothetical protein VK528_11390 [Flavobacterium sp.]|nr:hypothetical protein [Flavobacterium sp.]